MPADTAAPGTREYDATGGRHAQVTETVTKKDLGLPGWLHRRVKTTGISVSFENMDGFFFFPPALYLAIRVGLIDVRNCILTRFQSFSM